MQAVESNASLILSNPATTEALPTVQSRPNFPLAIQIPIGKSGKAFRTVQHFTNDRTYVTAKDIRAVGKEKGYKGNELTRFVNDKLKEQGALRGQLGVAYLQGLLQEGYIVDRGEKTKGTAAIRLVKPKAIAEDVIEINADMVSKMTPKERAALLKLIQMQDEATKKAAEVAAEKKAETPVINPETVDGDVEVVPTPEKA